MAQYSDKKKHIPHEEICKTFEMYHMFCFFLRSQDIIIEELHVQSAKGFLGMSLFFKAFTFESGYAFLAEYFIHIMVPIQWQNANKRLVVWQNN